MTRLLVDLVDEQARFRPGAVIEGVATWDLDRSVPHVEVRLGWHTEGRGTRDEQIVDRVTFDDPPLQDARPFRLALPSTPYSCSGTLISVCWTVEVSTKGVETARTSLTMSPDGKEIILPRTPEITDEDMPGPVLRSG